MDLFYPWKCNRHPPLVSLAAREGWGAEVTTPGDLAGALGATRDGRRVVFQGPAKDPRTIDAALAAGAWLIADGTEDAKAIIARARKLGVAPRYLLRFRPAAAEPPQRRFGMSAPELLTLGRWIVRGRRPLPEGLAFHLGTGLASLEPFRSAVREAGRVANALSALGIAVRVLDAGGGFAAGGESRFGSSGRPRGAGRVPHRIVPELVGAVRDAVPAARLFLEPGRAVASDAFHLVARVVRRGSPPCVRRRFPAVAMRSSFRAGATRFFRCRAGRGGGIREIAGPLPVDLDVLSGARIDRPSRGRAT